MAVGTAAFVGSGREPLPVHSGRGGIRLVNSRSTLLSVILRPCVGRRTLCSFKAAKTQGSFDRLTTSSSRQLQALRMTTLLLVALSLSGCAHRTANTGELRFTIASDPKTLNPLLVEDDSSEIVRYLTGGVLIRVNRKTQENEPALASSWKVSKDGRQIDFE